MPIDRVLRVLVNNRRKTVRVVEQNRRGDCFNPGFSVPHSFLASNGFVLNSISVPEIVLGGTGLYARGDSHDSDNAVRYFEDDAPGGDWDAFKAKLRAALEEYNTEGGEVMLEV